MAEFRQLVNCISAAAVCCFALLAAAPAPTTGQTFVHFRPDVPDAGADYPPVAAGFAYAFRAPAHPELVAEDGPGATGKSSSYAGQDLAKPKKSKETSGKKYTGEKKAFGPNQALKTQYHSQDQLGQYAYGYVHDDASHHEERTLNGGVTGTYTYYDDQGVKQSAQYVADNNGYRVQASGLPVIAPEPVKPTPEVEAATTAHLKAVLEARAARRLSRKPNLHLANEAKVYQEKNLLQSLEGLRSLPVLRFPIDDTPEVAAARAAHLEAFDKIRREREQFGLKFRSKREAHHPHSGQYHGGSSGQYYKGQGGGDSGQYYPGKYPGGSGQYHGHKYSAGGGHTPYSGGHHAQHSAGYHASSPHQIGLPVTPTPEVQAAAHHHLQAVQAAHHYGGSINVGVPDTYEVAAARDAHLQAFHQIAKDHAKRW